MWLSSIQPTVKNAWIRDTYDARTSKQFEVVVLDIPRGNDHDQE